MTKKKVQKTDLHILHKRISGHLSKELRKKYKKRALPIRKGDTVMILVGKFRKKAGKVTSVNTKLGSINVESIQITKKDGKTAPINIEPSNVIITELYVDDERRYKHIKVENKGEKNGK
ncbi:MAG: 50S ribosomal protein L24 [Candidatus Diapherotrites archaeon CG08_land_8_20_14_0_20_30_16]|nr:MAG: 50S ribosomal protein L24 [Candidatus Diapherotrites archaeon CG08_land_8_20_14_0_20_30_16]